MAFEQRDYAGGAVPTELASGINDSDLSIEIDSSTGWPSGGASGPFFVVIDRGLSKEEKVEIQSRSGTTLTVASTGKRGVDGTSAASHDTGATIEHCFTAQDAAEANSHIANTSLDHHTQYLTSTRHGAVSHTQAMLGTNSVGAAQIQTGAVGADELANNAVDTGAIQDEAVTTAKIDDEAVTTAKIDDLAVTTAKINDLAVTAAKLAADAVEAGKIDDGAIDAGSQLVDGILTLAKFGLEEPVDYVSSITWTNPTANFIPGSGAGATRTAYYYKLGKLVFMLASFTLGTDGNILGPNTTLEVSLPFTAGPRGFCAVRARDVSTGTPWSGTGVIGAGTNLATNFGTAGVANVWDGDYPFDWTSGDSFDMVAVWFTNE